MQQGKLIEGFENVPMDPNVYIPIFQCLGQEVFQWVNVSRYQNADVNELLKKLL